MIQASRTLSVPSLSASHIRRRRPLRLAPPAGCVVAMRVDRMDVAEPAWSGWRDDLRFFLGCYAAGLVFFFIMLS